MSLNKSKDALGDRMKGRFEDRCRFFLPRRTYTILRVDGKAFHTYARKAERPFDVRIQRAMQYAAMELCRNIQGAQLAYQQSDEISVLITDFKKEDTHAWFDNNVQKMASVAASIATMAFNGQIEGFPKNATFDARVFTIPDYIEVENYFLWRQGDCEKNSIQMLCRSIFSHKELHGKGFGAMNEMLFGRGINWAAYGHDMSCPEDNIRLLFKRGALITKVSDDGQSLGDWQVLSCYRWNTSEGRPQLRNRVPKAWPEDFPEEKLITPREAGPRKLKDVKFDDSEPTKVTELVKDIPESEKPYHGPFPPPKKVMFVGDNPPKNLQELLQQAIGRIRGLAQADADADVPKLRAKGQLKIVTPKGRILDLGEAEVDLTTGQPILSDDQKKTIDMLVMTDNLGKAEFEGTAKVETFPVPFQVLAKSSSTNSFGLRGVIVARPDGQCWEIGANQLNEPKEGEIIRVPFNGHELGFAALGYEIPRQMPPMPEHVVKSIEWKPELLEN